MDINTAVYEKHTKFKFRASSAALNEVRHTSKLTKFTLFKEIDGAYYRFCPWMRCTEFMNDFLHYSLYPAGASKGIYGFSKGHHDQYDPSFETIAIGFGDYKCPPTDMDAYDPRVSINLCKLLFDEDITVEVHPSGLTADTDRPSAKLYWNLIKPSPNLWSNVALMSLFFKSLRYHEWTPRPEAVQEWVDNPNASSFRDFTSTCKTLEVQDGDMIKLFRDLGLKEIKCRLDKYKANHGDNPGVFKGGSSLTAETIHIHGIQTALRRVYY